MTCYWPGLTFIIHWGQSGLFLHLNKSSFGIKLWREEKHNSQDTSWCSCQHRFQWFQKQSLPVNFRAHNSIIILNHCLPGLHLLEKELCMSVSHYPILSRYSPVRSLQIVKLTFLFKKKIPDYDRKQHVFLYDTLWKSSQYHFIPDEIHGGAILNHRFWHKKKSNLYYFDFDSCPIWNRYATVRVIIPWSWFWMVCI